MGKRKLKSLMASSVPPGTLLDSSHGSRSYLEVPPKPSRSPPGALLEPFSPGALCQRAACLVLSINKEWRASCRQLPTPSLQSPSTGAPGSKKGVRRQEAEGP